MSDTQSASRALSYSDSAKVKGIINRTLIVDWGTVKKVISDGVVEVLLSVASRKENVTVLVCTLINPCSASLAINLKPKVGDKVLILSPRKFDVDMFDVPESNTDEKDFTETIIEPYFNGYNKLCCLAILYNQFRPSTHKNTVVIDNDGALSLDIAYDKENDKNRLTLTTDKDGAFTFNSNDNTVSLDKEGALSVGLAYDSEDEVNKLSIATDKDGAFSINSNDNIISLNKDGELTANLAYNSNDEENKLTVSTDKDGAYSATNKKSTLSVDKNGYLSYTNTDDNKTKLEFTSSGFTVQDKNECKIVSSSSDIQINGKLKIKKWVN